MLIRYFSDLHIDLNRKSDFPIDDSDVFTIIAGDISGNPLVLFPIIRLFNLYLFSLNFFSLKLIDCSSLYLLSIIL